MIYILHSALHFFVWYPLTNKFTCVNKKEMPEYEVDMKYITEQINEGNIDEAHQLLGGVKDFICELPGEAESGIAVIEGPYSLQEASVKFSSWKIKFEGGKNSSLNSILTNLGIDSDIK